MDYIFSARNVRSGDFGSESGTTKYLEIPANVKDPKPSHAIGLRDWFNRVIDEGKTGTNARGKAIGDVLIHIHGFNNDPATVLERHRALRKGVEAAGFKGVLVSFDWPSASSALNYLEDRTDAKLTALRLVSDGIRPFSRYVEQDCEIAVHLFAHSMGAFVVREAFDDADDRPAVAATSWTVSQVMFAGADVSAESMGFNATSSSLYRHCVRLTNYSNPFDSILSISGAKRVGVSPRVGRIGLPDSAPPKAVNVNTGDYYDANRADFAGITNADHSWFFYDPVFLKDVFLTLQGALDRHVIPTRRVEDGQLHLRK
jgi:pimeloyl-ACP methyl ester carboxylesterase